jgi:hypothetical protein
MYTLRRDFDCGKYCNEWSIFIVGPDGQHVGGLQFDLTEEEVAQATCDGLNAANLRVTAAIEHACKNVTMKTYDFSTSLSRQQIQERLDRFNATNDWSIFNDVPKWQQVDVMYPTYPPGYRETEVAKYRK